MSTEGPIEDVRRLCSFEGRLAGTDAERRAAGWLADRLRGTGRRVDLEPTYVHPQWAMVQALHCLLALAGSLLALELPAVGFAIVLVTALSMYLDLNGRFYLLRRLFFRRASQNVVARERRRGASGRLILCAHYDAPRTGSAFAPRRLRPIGRLGRLLPVPVGPARIVFWSLAALLPVIGLRMAGIEESWVSILQLPPTLVLVVAVFLLVDAELSPVGPGANENASGVAVALAAAAELDRDRLEELEVWVVLPGAGETLMEGMRSFVRSHRGELDRGSTWFLELAGVGEGPLRWHESQGFAVSYGMRSRLTELCEVIAQAWGGAEDEPPPAARRSPRATDSLPAAVAGYPATTITCIGDGEVLPARSRTPGDTPDALDPDALDRACRFTVQLGRALDRDLARRAAR